MKTNLTPEQSDRLIELGVDPMLASCEQYVDTGQIKNGIELPPQPKPVFKLTDILAILPKEIYDEEISVTFYLVVETDCNNTWLATYREYCGGEIMMEIGEKVAPELIDALFELLCWVLKTHPDKIKQT